jgi:type III pantothenate kinase
MLLAVDIGNSNTKFGIFDSEKLLSKFSVSTPNEMAPEMLSSHAGNMPISEAIVCSVVPDKAHPLKIALKSAFKIDAFIVSNDLNFGLKINYDPLSSLGTDRLVNCFAAVEKYGAPCIVCSLGTATTFDVVSGDRTLIGGVIAPGMQMMANALHQNTAQLPSVKIEKPGSLLGNSTLGSIQSGIFYGHLAIVEWMIHKMRKQSGPHTNVIATGGFASLIAENTTIIDSVDENLLLDGLRMLHVKYQSA